MEEEGDGVKAVTRRFVWSCKTRYSLGRPDSSLRISGSQWTTTVDGARPARFGGGPDGLETTCTAKPPDRRTTELRNCKSFDLIKRRDVLHAQLAASFGGLGWLVTIEKKNANGFQCSPRFWLAKNTTTYSGNTPSSSPCPCPFPCPSSTQQELLVFMKTTTNVTNDGAEVLQTELPLTSTLGWIIN
jgi:hypothetical protein